MERFATNKNGNIDSRTEVLANNVTFMQQAKENAISNLFGDLFVEGILNTGNEDTMFKLTANNSGSNAGTFNVSQGIAYKQNVAVEPMIYERIAIIDDTEIYDATNPQQTTDDGTGNLVITPKSTGCKNIPIENADMTYYVDLRYLSVCDNKDSNDDLINYSIAKNLDNSNTQEKRFYKWIDGYQIVLVQTTGQIQGICLGTVSKNNQDEVTINTESKSGHLLINSKIFIEYFTSGQGIVITTEGNNTTLSVNVDNKTLEIEDNYVRVTKDGLYPFSKFTVNSGPDSFLTNPQGNMIALNISAGLEPLWISPAYNDRYSITNETAVVALNAQTEIQSKFSGNAGIYTICINNTDKDNNNVKLTVPKLEIMYEVSGGKNNPPNIAYKIFLDITREPYKAKWFNGSDWVDYYGVPIGLVQVSSGGIITGIKQFEFNRDYSKWESVGTIAPYLGGEIPDKYLLCNGVNNYSTLLYNDLYRKLGTKFGGTTGVTFGVPDFTNRVIWGGSSLDTFTYISSGLPNIKGVLPIRALFGSGASGALYDAGASGLHESSGGDPNGRKIGFDANRSNSIYSDNNSIVQPPALQVPILIKYTI